MYAFLGKYITFTVSNSVGTPQLRVIIHKYQLRTIIENGTNYRIPLVAKRIHFFLFPITPTVYHCRLLAASTGFYFWFYLYMSIVELRSANKWLIFILKDSQMITSVDMPARPYPIFLYPRKIILDSQSSWRHTAAHTRRVWWSTQ